MLWVLITVQKDEVVHLYVQIWFSISNMFVIFHPSISESIYSYFIEQRFPNWAHLMTLLEAPQKHPEVAAFTATLPKMLQRMRLVCVCRGPIRFAKAIV